METASTTQAQGAVELLAAIGGLVALAAGYWGLPLLLDGINLSRRFLGAALIGAAFLVFTSLCGLAMNGDVWGFWQ